MAGGSIYQGDPSLRVTAALAVQAPSAFELREPAFQPPQGVDSKLVDLPLWEEDAAGLGQPQLAILVLILAVVLMAAPILVAGMALLNNAFVLSHGSPLPDLELSSLAIYARVLVALALAFTVIRAPRER